VRSPSILLMLCLLSLCANAVIPSWVKPGAWIKLGADSYPGYFIVSVLNRTDGLIWVDFTFVQIGGGTYSTTYLLDENCYIVRGNYTGTAFPFLFFPTPRGAHVNIAPGVEYRLEYANLFGRDVYILSSEKYRFVYDAESKVFAMSSTPNNTDRIYIVDTNVDELKAVVSWGNKIAPRMPPLFAYFTYGVVTFMVFFLAFMIVLALIPKFRRFRRPSPPQNIAEGLRRWRRWMRGADLYPRKEGPQLW